MPTAPDTTAAPADVSSTSSGPSLADSLGEMFGDYRDETPESSDSSAAGTTPAEPVADDAGTSDGTADSPVAGDATVASDGTPPVSPSAPADDADPFAGTTPATYYVNGQPVTSNDIHVFKEGGAVIKPESLPNVLSQLADRASLSERFRSRDAEYQTLAKVSEWTDQTSGKTYTGPEAVIQMRIGNAALFAENQLMSPIITSEDLQPYLTTKFVMAEDGTRREVVIFRPDIVGSLAEKARFQKDQVDFAIRKHYAGATAELPKAAPAPTVDFKQATPSLVAAVAKESSLDAALLTADDLAHFAELLPAHVQNGLADRAWQKAVTRTLTERAQHRTSTQTLVASTEKATKDAQARMAAAARGMKPKPAVVTPTRAPSADVTRQQNEGDLYDAMETASARAMRQRA